MTKSDWKKDFREMVYKYNRECKPLKEVDNKFLERIEDFIRQTRKQARQEGIEEAIEAIKTSGVEVHVFLPEEFKKKRGME